MNIAPIGDNTQNIKMRNQTAFKASLDVSSERIAIISAAQRAIIAEIKTEFEKNSSHIPGRVGVTDYGIFTGTGVTLRKVGTQGPHKDNDEMRLLAILRDACKKFSTEELKIPYKYFDNMINTLKSVASGTLELEPESLNSGFHSIIDNYHAADPVNNIFIYHKFDDSDRFYSNGFNITRLFFIDSKRGIE